MRLPFNKLVLKNQKINYSSGHNFFTPYFQDKTKKIADNRNPLR
jgi:hypothetical protein